MNYEEWFNTLKEGGIITSAKPGITNLSFGGKKKEEEEEEEEYKIIPEDDDFWRSLKSQETATRSAILWASNDHDFYQQVKHKIKSLLKYHPEWHELDWLMQDLAKWLPEQMIHMEGFMQELMEMEPSDGLSDVDWDEVAEYFTEDVDDIRDDLYGDAE